MASTPVLRKPSSQVNPSGSSALDAQIAALPDGGYVVVWSGDGIDAQRFDRFGEKVGGVVNVSGVAGIQPAVTSLPNGTIAIAFAHPHSGLTGEYDIRVTIFNSSLGFVRGDNIATTTSAHTITPEISAFLDGRYVVTYESQPAAGGNGDMVGRIVSAAGSIGAEFPISSETDDQDQPQVAALTNGNFVTVFSDQFGGNTNNRDIIFAIRSASAQILSAPVAGANGGGQETDPDVAALSGGGFAVVWSDADNTGGLSAAVYNSSGGLVRANLLASLPDIRGINPRALGLPDGGFVLTWNDGSQGLARGQRFDATGLAVGTVFDIQRLSSSGYNAEGAVLADGRIAFAIGREFNDTTAYTSIWDPDPGINHPDFNGDGKADILWRHTGGTTVEWLMNGAANLAQVSFDNSAAWKVHETADFDGDGKSDILWRHDGGGTVIWLMDGIQQKAQGGSYAIDNSWHVKAAADFDGDGKSDILWRHDSGSTAIWFMNGGSNIGQGGSYSIGTDWKVVSVDDFNGDAKADILWRHTGGQTVIWTMNGGSNTGQASYEVNSGWHVAGTGDFDGDTKADILWRHDGGADVIWFMDGLNQKGQAVAASVDPSWKVQSVEDFTGDGKADILWRQDGSGSAVLWGMDGASNISQAALTQVDTNWSIVQHPYDIL
jgi:FG-GAP-like repeat